MKMMFNGLDRPFELSNSRYGREAQETLCFTKHHSLTLYIYMSHSINYASILHKCYKTLNNNVFSEKNQYILNLLILIHFKINLTYLNDRIRY
jgi:hypothetical protein